MKLITYWSLFFLCFSCSSNGQLSNAKLSKNKSLYNSLYKKNGNVFVLGSLDFHSSYMWSYENKALIVYSLTNGKVKSQKTYSDVKYIEKEWLKNPVSNDDKLDECIAVDGSTVMYRVGIVERKFPIQYKCLKDNVYSTNFFKGLVEDMNKYNIGWKE